MKERAVREPVLRLRPSSCSAWNSEGCVSSLPSSLGSSIGFPSCGIGSRGRAWTPPAGSATKRGRGSRAPRRPEAPAWAAGGTRSVPWRRRAAFAGCGSRRGAPRGAAHRVAGAAKECSERGAGEEEDPDERQQRRRGSSLRWFRSPARDALEPAGRLQPPCARPEREHQPERWSAPARAGRADGDERAPRDHEQPTGTSTTGSR